MIRFKDPERVVGAVHLELFPAGDDAAAPTEDPVAAGEHLAEDAGRATGG